MISAVKYLAFGCVAAYAGAVPSGGRTFCPVAIQHPRPFAARSLYMPTPTAAAPAHSFFDNVRDLAPLSWNDKISSIAVVSGNWQCCKNAGFQFPLGPVLTPGVYRDLSQYSIDNDSISSIMCVS